MCVCKIQQTLNVLLSLAVIFSAHPVLVRRLHITISTLQYCMDCSTMQNITKALSGGR